jgi:hypothetical protein
MVRVGLQQFFEPIGIGLDRYDAEALLGRRGDDILAQVLIGLIANGSLSSNSRTRAEPASQSDSPVSPDQSR